MIPVRVPSRGGGRASAAGSVLTERPELIDWAIRRLIINADEFVLTRGVNRDRMAVDEEQGLGSQLLLAPGQP